MACRVPGTVLEAQDTSVAIKGQKFLLSQSFHLSFQPASWCLLAYDFCAFKPSAHCPLHGRVWIRSPTPTLSPRQRMSLVKVATTALIALMPGHLKGCGLVHRPLFFDPAVISGPVSCGQLPPGGNMGVAGPWSSADSLSTVSAPVPVCSQGGGHRPSCGSSRCWRAGNMGSAGPTCQQPSFVVSLEGR